MVLELSSTLVRKCMIWQWGIECMSSIVFQVCRWCHSRHHCLSLSSVHGHGTYISQLIYVSTCLHQPTNYPGSYAQYSLCQASHVFPLPAHVSFAQGACLGTPAFTAHRALFEKGRGRAGDSVFVHGRCD
jgi:D-arabinose 1-dehydrogenase-like Zn-dependent alcohol dehydrogenase